MNESWKSRFDGAPIVDLFGILENRGWGGWMATEGDYPYSPETPGSTHLAFEGWRVGNGEPHLTRLYVSANLTYGQWNSFASPSTWNTFSRIVHIKVRIVQNSMGFPQMLFEEWVGPITDDAELNEIHRQLSEPVVLNMPPLPALELSKHGVWEGQVYLPSWKSFYLQSGYMPGHKTHFSLGMGSGPMPAVRLGYKGVPPSPEQIAAYVYLTENEKAVHDALLQAFFDNYPCWQGDYDYDVEEYLPSVTHPEQFQSLLLIGGVLIHGAAKDGVGYITLSLLPEWDIEHGMEVILHKDRVVAMGHSDCNTWEAIEQEMDGQQKGE